ncbi:hypothetical protein BU17DRAFT_87952 [Hysterangium stoloniferum]|nr:hypothetical protein BU17DRAFT_87952 [Hysterangium stoloniferum]
MSRLNNANNENEELSSIVFATVPGMMGLPDILQPPHSGGGMTTASSHMSLRHNIPREERCFITKSVSYMHERAHWINAVRGDNDLKNDVELLLADLGVTGDGMDLDQESNLTNLERNVHAALDKYAFIAVTGSLQTINQLFDMVNAENNLRQGQLDTTGVMRSRKLNFSDQAIVNPQNELVALHPEHFLISGSVLSIYDPLVRLPKMYVPAPDRRLREFPGAINHATLPPFTFTSSRAPAAVLNPFFVILNAEIKFRRYLRQINSNPPSTPLPNDVLHLINRTIDLVRLLYWKPTTRPGTLTKGKGKSSGELPRRNPPRYSRPAQFQEADDNGEDGMTSMQGQASGSRHTRPAFQCPKDADLATCGAIGSALLSTRDREHDSAYRKSQLISEGEYNIISV